MTAQKKIRFEDGIETSFGLSDDMRIYHSGSAANIRNFTGDLIIEQNTNDGDILFKSDDGSGGLATYMSIDGGITKTVFSRDTKHSDSKKALFGDQDDLQIYHDASNSYIDETGTGSLFIRASDIFLKTNTSENAISCASNGSVELYHNNAKKFETTATGALVTGFIGVTVGVDVTGGNIDLVDNSKIRIGTSQDLQLFHDGNNSNIENNAGALFITNRQDNGDIIFKSDDGSGGVTTYLTLDGGYSTPQLIVPDSVNFNLGNGLDLALQHDGSNSFITNNVGNLTIKNNADDGDIIFQSDDGSGGVETYFFLDGSISSGSPVTIFPDNSQLMFGDAFDLRIYHDGSNSYIADSGTGGLKILAADFNVNVAADNASMIRAIDGGTVELYFGGAKKLETTATGISVTGATGTTEGGGIDATDAVSIKVGEVNGEIITTIFVDIGIGSIQSSSTNTGAIGNGTDAAAYITRVTTAINGIVYKVELICVEAPTVASGALSADIDLTANSSSIASGSAVSGSPICNSAGDHALGRFVRSADSTTNTITPDDYLYLAQGTTNAGVYNAGKFLIRLFGAKTTGL